MLKRRGYAAIVLGVVACGWACSGGEGSFEGSWKRVGLLDSSISLRDGEDGIHFRWRLTDREKNIRCEVDDFCEEFRADDRVYEYRFEIERAAGSEGLTVKCHGLPVVEEMEPVDWVDWIVLREDGRELWSYLLEMNGEKMEPPIGPIRFVKVSDTPF